VTGKSFRRRELFALRVLARLNALIGQQYIVLSRYLERVVRRHGARVPVAVIPVYGVDTGIFKPPAEAKALLRERLGLPATGALIFFSSRIAPEKDGETLLDAVRMLLERGRDIRLLHRSGGYQGFLKDAERFCVSHRVIATDAVHPHLQLPVDYQACDLCVQASRAEGLGFSPLEALACEVPVIATAVGGLAETIIDGQTGWTYPAGDARALASRIELVLDDPQEATRRAAHGREMVKATYERRMVFEKLEGLALAGTRMKSKTEDRMRKDESVAIQDE
jgi:glycosyltransferase involved in cell wall biosynthesis